MFLFLCIENILNTKPKVEVLKMLFLIDEFYIELNNSIL